MAQYLSCGAEVLKRKPSGARREREEIKNAGKGAILLATIDLGRNGAALAALGEIAGGFLPLVASFADKKEGVKLGESTFNDFFKLTGTYQHPRDHFSDSSCTYFSKFWVAVDFSGSWLKAQPSGSQSSRRRSLTSTIITFIFISAFPIYGNITAQRLFGIFYQLQPSQ